MTCERAQEFFSDYLENALDRPMRVAIQAHLSECAVCQRELGGLRSTWQILDAVPMVEPSRALALQIQQEIRQRRLEQLEAERRRRPSFWEWLSSWRPAPVAAAAALATLIVAGIWIWPNIPDAQKLGSFPFLPGWVISRPVTIGLAIRTLAPVGAVQRVQVDANASEPLPDGKVIINGETTRMTDRRGSVIVLLPAGRSPVRSFEVQVLSVGRGLAQTYRCFVPLNGGAGSARVTLPAREYSLAEAVEAFAAQLGQPFILAGDVGLNKRAEILKIVDVPAQIALAELASKFRVGITSDEGGHHLVAR